jgi:LmbE family N-acetylglucosaminyl deacetylase
MLLYTAFMETVSCQRHLAFTSSSRLLLIAPHPDDETLGCGVVLQRAARTEAAIQVAYATDGDDNPWPQRLIDRWRLGTNDRKRWGQLRSAEALAALRVLGVRASEASFLGLPDQGLTNLLIRDCRSTLERFAAIIRDWSPTHLLVPSVADTHPDHNALAVILRLALAEFFPDELPMSVWSYAIHGQSRAFFERAQEYRQSEGETETKLRAIRCHKTQLKLSRGRFLAYAARPERFLELSSREPMILDGSIRSISRQQRALQLDLQLPLRPPCARSPRLLLFGYDAKGTSRCIAIPFPGDCCRIEMRDVVSKECVGNGAISRERFRRGAHASHRSLFPCACHLCKSRAPASLVFR